MGELGSQLEDLLGKLGGRKRKRTVTVAEARELLAAQQARRLVDRDEVRSEAVRRAEQLGVVFLDEIDKICSRENARGADVSREGVQRDLLPIVEGAAINTRHGVVRSDHILFIAAGAFNISRPADLIPEFQGRFPIRVELQSLGQDDFERILREPDSSLIKQYTALVAAEGCRVRFEDDAIKEIARVSARANERAENIGARRLQTVMTTLLEELLFELPESGRTEAVFSAKDVRDTLDRILADDDLTRYIL
jgi:ATP-dependent HslUV protease ATP-binding subunit HslU